MVSDIFKDRLKDRLTDGLTDKGDYYGPNQVNLGTKIGDVVESNKN